MVGGFFSKLIKGGPERASEPGGAGSSRKATTSGPWIGVDLDGTLAVWDARSTIARIGRPVPQMLELVTHMVADGMRVKIFTARAEDPEQIPLIRKWLRRNGLPELEITNVKDYEMQRLYDDRAVQVEQNTGRIIGSLHR